MRDSGVRYGPCAPVEPKEPSPPLSSFGIGVAVMRRGQIVETGEAVAVCDRPREHYTRQLIAATPDFAANV